MIKKACEILDKGDEKFVIEATDTYRRAVLIGKLEAWRITATVFLGIICIVAVWAIFSSDGRSSAALFISVIWVYLLSLYTDLQIKMLKLFERILSGNPAQPTTAHGGDKSG
jgi:hypothetical protein